MKDFLLEWFVHSAQLTAQAAPFVLLGLGIAGLVHVLIPEAVVLRWMGGRGLAGALRAALVGIPLPICSCGVVPLAIELDRKGAGRPATASFLVTTPESSVDSILLTWGLMGPLMAITRPVAAFATGMLAAVFNLGGHAGASPSAPAEGSHPCRGCCTLPEAGIATGQARAGWWRRWVGPSLRYGYGSLLDDIAAWLMAGLAVGGLLAVVLPEDLGALGLGGGPLPLLLMVVVGVPLYTCASAATPVTAVMIAKGLSPGAALVFLLAAPATSIATILLLASRFGRRFVVRYVTAVATGALAAGALLDLVVEPQTIREVVVAATRAEEPPAWWSTASAVLLVGLAVRSVLRRRRV